MKIATYNILKGGTRRVPWVKMVEDHGVDLLLVQESFDHEQHLPQYQYADAHGQCVWERVDQTRWGSAVYSRTGQVKPVCVTGYSGWVVAAKITGAEWQVGFADPLLVFSAHVP